MCSLTCPEVAEQIDLYAAGECAGADRLAIRRHLEGCPACAQTHEEARHLQGLLDLRLQEADRLRRLRQRLEAEDVPRLLPLPKRLSFSRQAAALAALLLLTIGLSWWTMPGPRPEQTGGLGFAVALVDAPSRAVPGVMAKDIPQAAGEAQAPKHRTYILDLGGKTPEAYRQQLRAAAEANQLPPPPEVNLALEVRNTTDREMLLWPGSDGTELKLDLRGPGLVRFAMQGEAAPFLTPEKIRLAPGESHSVPIPRLIDGSLGRLRSLFWTEPGVYTLTVHYRVLVSLDGLKSFRTVSSGPIRIELQSR
jgi:hypothetical protein